MTALTRVDIFWQEPGWYVREVIYDRAADKERHEYHFVAPLDISVAEMQAKIKAYERPPDYLTPRVTRWRKRPAVDERTTIHDPAL